MTRREQQRRECNICGQVIRGTSNLYRHIEMAHRRNTHPPRCEHETIYCGSDHLWRCQSCGAELLDPIGETTRPLFESE